MQSDLVASERNVDAGLHTGYKSVNGIMKTKKLAFLSLLLFGFLQANVARGAAPDSASNGFRFPLPLEGTLTSTFSEYRSGHFHAGIDLSTGGKIGIPVAAVRSGYVYRVRVSGAGYGKAVDLLLDNGMLATYGHLDRFSARIDSFARAKQLEFGSYEVDVFPSPSEIPVAAGETIAYSGNTGFSFGPHLHFELRRGEVAVNPLPRIFLLADYVPPTFKFIKLTPMGPNSEIEGENSSRIFSLRGPRERGTYVTSTVPEVAGTFLVSVSVFDRTEKASNRLSVYELRLFLDDSLLFESKFDEIESARTHEVELAYDCGLARRGEVYTFNLARFEGSKLRLLKGLKQGAGIIDTDLLGLSGAHVLRIQASDAAGNSRTAFLNFLVYRKPAVTSVALQKRGSSLVVRAEVDDAENSVSKVWADYLLGTLSGEFSTLTFNNEEQSGLPGATASYSARLELPSSLAETDASRLKGVFRVWAKDKRGRSSSPFTVVSLGGEAIKNASVSLELARDRDYAEIIARAFPSFLRPKIGIAQGDTTWLKVEERGDGQYLAKYKYEPVASDGAAVVALLEAGNSSPISASKALGVQTARRGWEGSIWNQDGSAGFTYGPETFYEDTYLTLGKREREILKPGLRFASDIFSISPDDVVFDKPGTVVIRCDGDLSVADRIGLYRKESQKKWSYVGSIVDTLKRTVGASVRTLSEFALIRDEAAPSVSIVRPRRGRATRSGTPPLYAVVRDIGSGVRWQEMSVLVDGKKVLAEWDPRISRLSVVYNEPLREGEHTAIFDVSDRAGNKSLAETRFRVAR